MTSTTSAGAGNAFADERQLEIARIVEEQRRARVTELADRFGVSAVTIRKDLDVLAESERVIRTHGGAIASDIRRTDLSFDVRDRLQREEKAAIGALAASRVNNGESILIDASTTGVYLAIELSGRPGISVLLMGGLVRSGALSVVGQLGDAVFDRVNVQKAFVSAAGFTLEEGLTETTEEEAQIKRVMVNAAREVYALIDSSKWGRVASATFCRVDGLIEVFTDEDAPGGTVASLKRMGIEVTQHG